jgi:uncharacterized membrane protein
MGIIATVVFVPLFSLEKEKVCGVYQAWQRNNDTSFLAFPGCESEDSPSVNGGNSSIIEPQQSILGLLKLDELSSACGIFFYLQSYIWMRHCYIWQNVEQAPRRVALFTNYALFLILAAIPFLCKLVKVMDNAWIVMLVLVSLDTVNFLTFLLLVRSGNRKPPYSGFSLLVKRSLCSCAAGVGCVVFTWILGDYTGLDSRVAFWIGIFVRYIQAFLETNIFTRLEKDAAKRSNLDYECARLQTFRDKTRFLVFCDGVFAIAATAAALELKVDGHSPELWLDENLTQILITLCTLINVFFCWLDHHGLFERAFSGISTNTLLVNMVTLSFVICLPYSLSFAFYFPLHWIRVLPGFFLFFVYMTSALSKYMQHHAELKLQSLQQVIAETAGTKRRETLEDGQWPSAALIRFELAPPLCSAFVSALYVVLGLTSIGSIYSYLYIFFGVIKGVAWIIYKNYIFQM